MRIALVTEQFSPADEPAARVTREVTTRLVADGHDVVVFACGRGQATFHGARMFWASRMTPVSAVREAMALSRPDVCHLVDPHRLGMKAAEAAERLGIPTVVLGPRGWAPGVDPADHHPGLRDEALHARWARAHAPDGGQLVAGYFGPLTKRNVLGRLATVARLPGVRLLAVGEGPGAEQLRSAGAKVVPHASGVERARCLATVDVLLQPRKRETCSPVVLEALASGVPVVAYAAGTAADVVRHERTGLLVPTERGGRAFARHVARLAASPDLRHVLSTGARESVADRTWDQAVRELVDVHYAAALPATTSGQLAAQRLP
ncbi:Glycosyl transferases group 1 [Nocardioides scoriae]|uniref:Glycosyl transferases group 1 n=1 Tax=Nocardioides scoriae TaxID=642780 RepID=A0A1H1RC30_9ACTN|nr:glycosyltransferase [Nocardioides scoriae]SDS33344.1 Glycosyl transferases group 1 [Nocardioides scoriae]